MKNVKKVLAAVVLSCTLLTPIKAYGAINPSLMAVEESKNNINLKIEDADTIVKSFQISLKVTGVKVNSINWSEKIKNNASADFIDNNGTITVYVTSKVNLLEDDGTLNIGTLKVTGNDGDEYSISPENLKLVSINNKTVKADAVSYEGESTFSASTDVEDSAQPEVPGEDVKPESPEVPGTGAGEDDKKDESSDKDGVIDNMPSDTTEDKDSENDALAGSESTESSKDKNSFAGGALTGESMMLYGALSGIALSSAGVVFFRSKGKRGKH